MSLATTLRSFVRLPAEPAPVGPHKAALDAHLQSIAANQAQTNRLAAQEQAAFHDLVTAESAQQSVEAAQTALDESLGIARYVGSPGDNVPELKAALHAAQERLAIAEQASRSALVARRKFADDRAKLREQTVALHAQTPRLLHLALIEQMQALHPEWLAAVERTRVVHRKIFRLAKAADSIGTVHHLAPWLDSKRHEMLQFFMPKVPPFEPEFQDEYGPGRHRAAEVAAMREDWAALDREAQQLIADMLNGTAP